MWLRVVGDTPCFFRVAYQSVVYEINLVTSRLGNYTIWKDKAKAKRPTSTSDRTLNPTPEFLVPDIPGTFPLPAFGDRVDTVLEDIFSSRVTQTFPAGLVGFKTPSALCSQVKSSFRTTPVSGVYCTSWFELAAYRVHSVLSEDPDGGAGALTV